MEKVWIVSIILPFEDQHHLLREEQVDCAVCSSYDRALEIAFTIIEDEFGSDYSLVEIPKEDPDPDEEYLIISKCNLDRYINTFEEVTRFEILNKN